MNYNKTIDIHTKKDFLATRKFPPWKKQNQSRTEEQFNKSQYNNSSKTDIVTNRTDKQDKKVTLNVSERRTENHSRAHDNMERNDRKKEDDILWERQSLQQKERDKIFYNDDPYVEPINKRTKKFDDINNKLKFYSDMSNMPEQRHDYRENKSSPKSKFNKFSKEQDIYKRDMVIHPYRQRDWGSKIDVIPGAINEPDLYQRKVTNNSPDVYQSNGEFSGKNMKLQPMRFKYLESTFQHDQNIEKIKIPETHPSWKNLNDFKLEDCNKIHKFTPSEQKKHFLYDSLKISDY